MPPFCSKHLCSHEIVTMDNGAGRLMCRQCWVMQEIDERDRERRAAVEIPENLTVGQLNQAVKDLRESLYQQRLKTQEMEKSREMWMAKCQEKSDEKVEALRKLNNIQRMWDQHQEKMAASVHKGAECSYCHGVGACPRCWGRAAIERLTEGL